MKNYNLIAAGVIDHEGRLVYSTTIESHAKEQDIEWAEATCHDHINEAGGSGLEGSGKWIVRLLYFKDVNKIKNHMNNIEKDSKRYQWLKENGHLDIWWGEEDGFNERLYIDEDIDQQIKGP